MRKNTGTLQGDIEMNEIAEKYFNQTHMEREREYIEGLIAECESPIEELFVTAFYSYGAKEELEAILDYFLGGNPILTSSTQMKIGKYRVDFAIKIRWDDGASSIYVVELDGHEFHEKTKEQVRKGNERDRFFISSGITILHFSGSEVYNDPDGCVESVVNCITDCEFGKRKKE